jgi:hypothetical protein
MKKEDLSHIIIFGGSLSELNEKYQDRKYEIADNFFTTESTFFPYEVFRETKKEIKMQGYDGIIRSDLNRGWMFCSVNGLPVKRVK